MTPTHFELLVEEPSMETFLRQVLPKVMNERATFEIYAYQGKQDLLNRLEERLRGYARWLPPEWRVVVIVDRDNEDCLLLKQKMQEAAQSSSLRVRGVDTNWQLAFRIAIEELESWYFGDWTSVRDAYPRVGQNVAFKAAYRVSDAIAGGTWEAFEREMQRVGYFQGGLQKVEAARSIGESFQPSRCTSASFKHLCRLLEGATNG